MTKESKHVGMNLRVTLLDGEELVNLALPAECGFRVFRALLNAFEEGRIFWEHEMDSADSEDRAVETSERLMDFQLNRYRVNKAMKRLSNNLEE